MNIVVQSIPAIVNAFNGTLTRARHCSSMRRWAWVLMLLACPWAFAEQLQVSIEGLNEELAQAVRANLQLEQYVPQGVTPVQARRLFKDADAEIRTALEPYGYYNPDIQSDLARTNEGMRASFRIDAGPPTVVRAARVYVEGEGQDVAEVGEAVADFQPQEGEILNHSLYETSKAAVDAALRSMGFLDAKLTAHRVEVTRGANAATLEVAWESGPRYRFGEVSFPEVQFSQEFLERYVPWKKDAYYSADELLNFQQRLVDADYFSSVAVQPNLERARQEGDATADVPIDVLLVPAKRTMYTAGAYLSTDAGPGVRFGWDRRWMNRRGHKFNTELEYSQRLQALSSTYRIPRPGPQNRSYNFGTTYRDEQTDTSESQTTKLVANEAREWRGFTRTLGLQFLAGDFEIAKEQRSSTLLFAEGSLTRKRADDLFFPLHGDSLNLILRFAPEGLGSDTSIAQLRAEAKWVRSFDARRRLIARAAVGAMDVGDFEKLPPDLRFFAGGDRSVRGFDYQAIGELNSNGLVVGGRYLTVVSGEYEHYFLEKWGAAAFVDAGDAFSSAPAANVGAGLGVRWKSPVGLLRLDVAHPLVTDLEKGLRIHVVIGPDL